MATIDRLFIAEKDSLGQDIAKWLSKTTGKPVQRDDGFIRVGSDAIASMSGHLLTKLDAKEYDPRYERWTLKDLPIIPEQFKLKVIEDDRGRSERRVRVIAKLLKECRIVVGAGDPDQEGQLLQDELLQYLGNRRPVVRFWANSLNDADMLEAMGNMRPNEEYRSWYLAALCRSHADWLYGINATRAFTVAAQNCGYEGMVVIGRVVTPTLWLIVERELARLAFKPKTFFTPLITCRGAGPVLAKWQPQTNAEGQAIDDRLDPEGYLVDRRHADRIVQVATSAGCAQVVKATPKGFTKEPPLLFSLTTLQAHCGNLFNMTSDEVLASAQRLYLAKITSYPRVECEHTKEAEHPLAQQVLESHGLGPQPEEIKRALASCRYSLKSKAWDTAKCAGEGHTAIVPVQLPDPSVLSQIGDQDLAVYREILKRFILQFWPAAKYRSMEAILRCTATGAEELFVHRSKELIDPGWEAAFPQRQIEGEREDESDDGTPTGQLQVLKVGDQLPVVSAEVKEGTTTIPDRYTDSTLIMAMLHIYRHVRNPDYRERLRSNGGSGIGTPATRSSTIAELVERKFVAYHGRRKELVPQPLAMRIMQLIPEQLRIPDMTAMWQLRIDEVKAGRSSYEQFIGKISAWVARLVQAAPLTFKPGQFGGNAATHKCFGTAGKVGCGAPLRYRPGVKDRYQAFFACTNEDCGKTFNAVDEQPVERVPRAELPPPEERIACPTCGTGHLVQRNKRDGGTFWGCSAFKTSGCRAGFDDIDGKPNLSGRSGGGAGSDRTIDTRYQCPKCGKGYLQRRQRKAESGGSYFWGCSAWRESGCKAGYDDVNEAPDIHNSRRYEPGGRPRISPRTGRVK